MRRGAHIAIIFVGHQMDYLVLIGFIFAIIAVARVELNHSMPGPDAVRQILQVEFANSGKVEARDLENDYYLSYSEREGFPSAQKFSSDLHINSTQSRPLAISLMPPEYIFNFASSRGW